MNRLAVVGTLTAMLVGGLQAQSFQRRASLVSGGSNQSGKCTVEVVVDGVAELEIRGDTGQIRNVSGQPPQWRRFECTGPLPADPVDFRFSGVDGRGRQQLIRDPRNGGAAVVRIEDPNGGQEAYTFDLTWGQGFRNGNGNFNPQPQGQNPQPQGQYRQPSGQLNTPLGQLRWGGRMVDRSYATEQAINVCRDAVRQQANDRFQPGRLEFRQMRIDDNPGRNDWVLGSVDVYHRGGREDHYQFSCSVNFDTGRVRSAELQPMNARDDRNGRYNNGDRDADRSFSPADRAVQGCQTAVINRMRNDGYRNVDIRSIRMDEGQGRNDYVVGNVLAQNMRGFSQSMGFSCSVDPRDGDVRTVDINRR